MKRLVTVISVLVVLIWVLVAVGHHHDQTSTEYAKGFGTGAAVRVESGMAHPGQDYCYGQLANQSDSSTDFTNGFMAGCQG